MAASDEKDLEANLPSSASSDSGIEAATPSAITAGKDLEANLSSPDIQRRDSSASENTAACLGAFVGQVMPVNPAVHPDEESDEPADSQEAAVAANDLGRPYTVFTPWEKRGIMAVASMAAFFSPLTAQIYLPALTTLADDFHVSDSQINLTVTTYMIFQGLTPMFFAGFADTAGRRPAYLLCFVIYIATNIGLALTQSYASLLVVRMLQSAGAAVTIALNQAVLSDVATSAERGKYMGFTVLPTILAPALGPLIGGALTQGLGWRSIFWFLAISASIVFIIMIFFFPETCRNVVDDGSVVPPRIYRTVWQVIKSALRRRRARKLRAQQRKAAGTTLDANGAPLELSRTISRRSVAPKFHFIPPNLLGSFQILFELEMGLILLQLAIVFAGFYAIVTTLPSQLTNHYGFDPMQVGLMYLPMAAGSAVSIPTTGVVIDRNYRRHAARVGITIVKGQQQDVTRINVERARLEVMLPALVLGTCLAFAWGWALHAHAHIAVLAVLMFLVGITMTTCTNCCNTLIIECCPGRAAAGIAANNISRCLLGAAMTAAIEPLIQAVGTGIAFTIVGALYVACIPILLALIKWGMGWRAKNAERQRLKKEKRETKLREKEEASS
jgi:multidrug resistance protein